MSGPIAVRGPGPQAVTQAASLLAGAVHWAPRGRPGQGCTGPGPQGTDEALEGPWRVTVARDRSAGARACDRARDL